jgi:hypothetical protein
MRHCAASECYGCEMIEPRLRAEFEQIGKQSVIKRIDASNMDENKQRQAYEWLDEQENGSDLAFKRRMFSIQIYVAIVSTAGALIALAALLKK